MIEIDRLSIDEEKGFRLGILFSWDSFKGVSFLFGKLVINIGTRKANG